jgi:hypothetical protein
LGNSEKSEDFESGSYDREPGQFRETIRQESALNTPVENNSIKPQAEIRAVFQTSYRQLHRVPHVAPVDQFIKIQEGCP